MIFAEIILIPSSLMKTMELSTQDRLGRGWVRWKVALSAWSTTARPLGVFRGCARSPSGPRAIGYLGRLEGVYRTLLQVFFLLVVESYSSLPLGPRPGQRYIAPALLRPTADPTAAGRKFDLRLYAVLAEPSLFGQRGNESRKCDLDSSIG